MTKKKKKKVLKFNIIPKKRFFICIFSFSFLFLALIIRIAVLQFIDGDSLKERAIAQQLTTTTINPKRGTIYDSNGKILAISKDVDTVSVNPTNVKDSKKNAISLELLANSFSSIFSLDYEETLQKLSEAKSYVEIAKKVDNDKILLLQDFIKNNDIVSGISISNDIQRYYPYDNLAANLIGFTGTDIQGLVGLESSLDDILSGTPGKIVSALDSTKSEIPNSQQSYIEVQDGSNITLTIDVNIQSVAEKYLEQAVNEHSADGGNVIIMNPNTGDILAMATYPNYNLNSPFTITDSKLAETYDSLSPSEKSNALYKMWRNTAVQSTYEPGSTFKLITAAVALEEDIVDPDTPDAFYCGGSETVSGISINCWRYYNPHLKQTLREALANSCNPSFMQLGLKIGAPTLYKYYKAFGLFNKTNSNFYGEENSVFYNIEDIHDIELAIMSFGQRFNVTPIQLITAVSAIANEGVLMQPNIISKIENPNTGAITQTEPTQLRQVISKETADQMMEMMEYVVTDGTGKYAQVEGFSVGGKSGTSEPLSDNEEQGYVASFIGVSPTINAEVVVLVTIYNPKGDIHQGGQVAGPVVSSILSEILPYLGVTSLNDVSSSSFNTTILPDVRNKTISEAKAILKNSGFNVIITGDEDENSTLIMDQMPKPGVYLIKNSKIYLYTENNNLRTSVTVPSFKGLSAYSSITKAQENGLNLVIDGSGIVISQDIAAR